MRQRTNVQIVVASLLLGTLPASGAFILLRGKVVMQDGSAPGKSVTIERFCYGRTGTTIAANAQKTGHYLYNTNADPLVVDNCGLRAVMSGYESTIVPISHLNPWSDPNLPDIILRERDASISEGNGLNTSDIYFTSSSIPANARQPWNNSIQAMRSGNFALAERQLRIVVKEAPNMAEGWSALGEVLQRMNRPEEAAPAYDSAARLDPKSAKARMGVLWADLELRKWPEAEAVANSLIELKADIQNPEIQTNRAIARFQLGNLAGAESSAQEGIRLDTKHQLPRSEMVLGTILEARGEFSGAREHMLRYLELDPRAADAADIREHMSNIGKATGGQSAPTLGALHATVEAAGEAWVPGGMKALAKMASMPGEPVYQSFFEEYCRGVGREVSVGTGRGIPRFSQSLRAFLASVTELIPLGEKRGDNAVIRISAVDRERREQARHVLALLGWTLEEHEGTLHVEPGYRPEDSLLQMVASALGIDQIAMQEKLQSGGEFQFEVVSENARLVGGDMWTQILIKDAVPPGGLAAVFATDPRIAKTCAGLNAMKADTAAAIMSAVGLRDLAAKHTEVIYRYGEVFSITNGRVDVPGGPSADPVWQKLVGANPRNPAEFFRALMEKDAGKLAAFYATLARADAAHQQYFTRTIERAEKFYPWFRNSDELKSGILTHIPGTRSEFLQSVPLDDSGNIHFPGGQSVWFPGAEVPLDNLLIEALVPVSRLEKKRGSLLDGQVVELLAKHHSQWTALYSYFEKLPAMGREGYAALAAFGESLGRRTATERNAVLGEWYALVDLITRGAKAGSLDAASAANAFRQASLDLSGDKHGTQAVALLRQLAGSGDLEEAVAMNLLKLDAEHRPRFDRALELLRVPRVAEAQANDIPAALSALVYAASLDPGLLVLNEDPGLLRRHRYAGASGPVFARAALHEARDANGAHFSGGFMEFEEAAKTLMGGAKAAPRVPIVARAVAPSVAANSDEPTADFRSDTKLVEVYTTVTDSRGHYVDDLTLPKFTLVNGKDPQTILGFEPQTSDLSVALLLDTTGSMVDTIASLKRSALKLMDSLRPGDSVAVYSFSDEVTEVAPYTTDRGITKRAVMNTRAFGNTALYDAIARTGHELTGRTGKKVVIVFTDGQDTSSMLTVDAAIERAKVAGIPVYTIAQGEASTNSELVRQLAEISTATGGASFRVRNPDDMADVFEKIAEDLAHGYLLYFQAPTAEDHAWREIHVVVGGQKDLRIRAREGYYP
ncbi:MAG: VWA domain-containing protein [Bryobacteraceae bacterium]